MLHAAYSVQDNVEDVEDIKTSHNRFLTDFLEFIWLLSKTSKILKQAITDLLAVYLIIVEDVEDVCVRITM